MILVPPMQRQQFGRNLCAMTPCAVIVTANGDEALQSKESANVASNATNSRVKHHDLHDFRDTSLRRSTPKADNGKHIIHPVFNLVDLANFNSSYNENAVYEISIIERQTRSWHVGGPG